MDPKTESYQPQFATIARVCFVAFRPLSVGSELPPRRLYLRQIKWTQSIAGFMQRRMDVVKKILSLTDETLPLGVGLTMSKQIRRPLKEVKYQRSGNKNHLLRVPLEMYLGMDLGVMFKRWARKKTAGPTKNGRDSKPKNLGVKKLVERMIPGNIIVLQRGTRFHPGNYVGIGKDHTLYALKEGCVKFEHHKLSGLKWMHVEPKDGHVLHPVYSSAAAPELKTAT
ncbi:hypothetical protein HAX54_008626, partial [Datura stramonium]|nr:hypothetical protein [Datura stramonium]